MYTELDEELCKDIENITNTDYEKRGELIEVESLKIMLEDMRCAYDVLKEELEDEKKDKEENYELKEFDAKLVMKEFDAYDFYGVSKEDFA